MKSLTPDVLELCTGSDRYHAETYADHIANVALRYEIDQSVERMAAFLATIAIESNRLSTVEESLYYRDATRLCAIYPRKFKTAADAEPYVCNHGKLSDLLYHGYHGRGLIQLTWEQNYLLAGNDLGYDYVATPSLVLEPFHAALTAGWFWDKNAINDVADDIDQVTLRVNGPRLMHLGERTVQYTKNMEFLA